MHNLQQNRRIIAIFDVLGLFRRWKTCALRSARKIVLKGRLNVEYLRREGNNAVFSSKRTNHCDF